MNWSDDPADILEGLTDAKVPEEWRAMTSGPAIEAGKVYLFTKSGKIVQAVRRWEPECVKLRKRRWWIVARVDTGKQMVASENALTPLPSLES